MEEKEYFDVLNENGEFTGIVESREKCHKEGLWHRANYCFIFNDKGEVLLQKRSANKKLWPNLWDVTAGGHVLAGEFGITALIREIKEEIGIEIEEKDINYLVGSTSVNVIGDTINKHFNECFIVNKNVDINDIILQEEEVSEIKWFSKDEIFDRIENNYSGITDKTGVWNFLKRYYETKNIS
jgi:isopentenyl-diphosphate Delta-isomerase